MRINLLSYQKYLETLSVAKNEEYMLGTKEEELKYLAHNKDRFIEALRYLRLELVSRKEKIKILDIGTSPLTFIIKQKYPDIALFTTDYSPKFRNRAKNLDIGFMQVDLSQKNNSLGNQKYDLILFLEVIEHLKGDHELVLQKISDSLKKGGICILQTPNRLSPKKLIVDSFLTGFWNLFTDAPSKSNEFNHFKEYSLAELVKLTSKLPDIKIIEAHHELYFDTPESAMVYRSRKALLKYLFKINYLVVKYIPVLRRGMIVIFRKDPH